MQNKTECSHPTQVELYFGIFKCSTCGHIWDEADEKTKAKRAKSQENAARREAKQEHYRRANRGKKGRRD